MSNRANNSQVSAPWYKNYIITIFVIGLPTFVVIACIAFVFFAFKIKDSTVRDDWYMDGKSLYQDVSKDKLAHDLGLTGVMRFNDGQVSFELKPAPENAATFNYPNTLTVKISHATDKNKDRDFTLTHTQGAQYQGQVQLDTQPAKYYLNVASEENGWRLTHSQKLPAQNAVFSPLSAFDQVNTVLPDQRQKHGQPSSVSQ